MQRTKGRKGDIPLGVLSVRDRVTDDVLEEDLEDTASLLVDETRDTLDTATAGKTTNGLRHTKKRRVRKRHDTAEEKG